MAFEVLEAHRSEAQPPKLARGMQQIQMRFGSGGANCPRHAVACFEQRPIETLSIKRDENRPNGHALGEFQQQRMLLIEIAHEELLHLQAARIPPRNAHQKRIRAGASGEACCLRVQKQPLFGVNRRFERVFRVRILRQQQGKGTRVRRAHFRRRKPLRDRQVFPIMIPPYLPAKKLRQTDTFIGTIRRRRGKRFPLPCGPQRGHMREFVVRAQIDNTITGFGTTDTHG
jgi:hypothetical protein